LAAALRPVPDYLADVRLVNAVGLVALAGHASPPHTHPSSASHGLSGWFSHTQPTPLQIGHFGFMPSKGP
jgi:hypothetical protein